MESKRKRTEEEDESKLFSVVKHARFTENTSLNQQLIVAEPTASNLPLWDRFRQTMNASFKAFYNNAD